jgi:prephenate dehydratase
MKVSIQGGKGSYSHIAADHIFSNQLELVEDENFEDAIKHCKEKEVEYAVIPFENSTHGSVIENFDLLTRYGLFIVKEIYLKINFHILVNAGVKFENIRNLYTHRVSISQIRIFLEQNPQIEVHVHSDNGRAAQFVRENNLKDSAAAASRLAAKIYDLELLKENIHDNPKNYTRFFVLSRENNYEKDANKTSISFIVKHETGTLVKALKCFSDEGISLTKIESRPLIGTEWEYIFYVDLLAGVEEEHMKRALEKAKESTTQLSILGSYKQGDYIET